MTTNTKKEMKISIQIKETFEFIARITMILFTLWTTIAIVTFVGIGIFTLLGIR